MAKFRVQECMKNVQDSRFAMAGTVVEGEIKPGMFLRVWFSMMLYYPYQIIAIEPLNDTASGILQLTFKSEIGEEILLEDLNLKGCVFSVSVCEP